MGARWWFQEIKSAAIMSFGIYCTVVMRNACTAFCYLIWAFMSDEKLEVFKKRPAEIIIFALCFSLLSKAEDTLQGFFCQIKLMIPSWAKFAPVWTCCGQLAWLACKKDMFLCEGRRHISASVWGEQTWHQPQSIKHVWAKSGCTRVVWTYYRTQCKYVLPKPTKKSGGGDRK